MTGVLQGLAVDGRIPIAVVVDPAPLLWVNLAALEPPAYYFRAMGFNSNAELLVYTDIVPQEQVFYAGHLPVNGLGMVFGTDEPPEGYTQGATPINIGDSNVWPVAVRCIMPLKTDLSFLVDQGGGAATFTRPSIGSYVDIDTSIIMYAATNQPRFESDGLLVEGTTINELLYSQAFTNAVWTQSGLLAVDNNVISPDGTQNATFVQMGQGSYFEQTTDFDFPIGTYVTASCFFKSDNLNVCSLRMDTDLGLVAGRVEFVYASETFTVIDGLYPTFEKLPDGWFRISFTYLMVTEDKIRLRVMASETTVTTGSLCNVWGAQVEPLEVATSYIPTTTVVVQRDQDILTIPPDNMTPAGTDWSLGITNQLLTEYELAGTNYMWEANMTTFRRGWRNSPQRAWMIGDDATVRTVGTQTNNKVNNRITGTFDQDNEAKIYANTILRDIDPIVTPDVGVVTDFSIGSRSSSARPMHGHLSNLRVYDAELTQAQINIEATFLNIMPRLCFDLVNPVTHWAQGVPYVATGAVAASTSVIPPSLGSFSSGFSTGFS
jgi:hypothetical protein